jgi:hypothetical protein
MTALYRCSPTLNSLHLLGKEKAGGSSPPVGSKFNKTISLHLLDEFLSQKCGKEMLFRRALHPNLVWQGHSEWHHIHRSGGDRRRRSVCPQWRPAGGRTGQDRRADIKGPNQPSVLFEGQLHGAGYALGWLPAPDSRASLSRRVCCEGHPATGCQAIGSLELTCHVALVSEAGLGSSSGK